MSQLPAQYVKRGLWVNQEEGTVLGRVITTDSQTGTLVVAIVTIITTFGTTHLWNLSTFLYHQIRANSRQTDGLFRQQQTLLCTLPTPGSVISGWAKLWWFWRHRSEKAFTRSIPQLLVAVAYMIATIAISLSASYIVSTSNLQILVDSPLCTSATEETKDLKNLERIKQLDSLSVASNFYAEECYRDFNTSEVPVECASFIRTSIDFEKRRVDCPFRSLCAKIELPGISFDSGLIDLNEGFGLNLPPNERVKYRRAMTCSVLDLTDRYVFNTRTNPVSSMEDPTLEFNLGERAGQASNVTTWVNLAEANATDTFEVATFSQFGSESLKNASSFTPLPEMSNDNADIALITVAKNHVVYQYPVDDPMFSAHQVSPSKESVDGKTLYKSDLAMSAVGCQTQYQFCYTNPTGRDTCTDLSYLDDTQRYPDATDVQRAALTLLHTIAREFDIADASSRLQVAAMAAQQGMIESLPNDHWVREITGWEAVLWSATQIAIGDFAVGIEPHAQLFRDGDKSGQQRLCTMQRIRNPGGFVNISVFGLAFTLTMCCVIIILDLVLLRFLIYLRKFRRTLAPRIDAWIQDGIFQLQRRAYESHGEGVWENLDVEIPLTKENVQLHNLPLESRRPYLPFQHQCSCQELTTTNDSSSSSLPAIMTRSTTASSKSGSSPLEVSAFPDPEVEEKVPN